MKKLAFLLCLILQGINFTSAQEYFFYHYKDKKILNRNYLYVAVKFKNNISAGESSAILQLTFGSLADSKSSVKYTYSSGAS